MKLKNLLLKDDRQIFYAAVFITVVQALCTYTAGFSELGVYVPLLLCLALFAYLTRHESIGTALLCCTLFFNSTGLTSVFLFAIWSLFIVEVDSRLIVALFFLVPLLLAFSSFLWTEDQTVWITWPQDLRSLYERSHQLNHCLTISAERYFLPVGSIYSYVARYPGLAPYPIRWGHCNNVLAQLLISSGLFGVIFFLFLLFLMLDCLPFGLQAFTVAMLWSMTLTITFPLALLLFFFIEHYSKVVIK